MSRQKKTRRVTDIMPTRKTDKKPTAPRSGRQSTRYELDAKAREEKKKRKHKGLASGSRHSVVNVKAENQALEMKDPRIGSRKKVPLMVEFVNKPQKAQAESAAKSEPKATLAPLDPMFELEQLENNECLNQLLDQLDEGKKLSAEDQKFVDACLVRVAQLMDELGIADDEENDEDLYRTFETININQFK